jgi:flagellar motor switch protein FliG
VLTDALGPDKANSIADRIVGARTGLGLDALKWMEPKSVAEVIKREHPQIAAIVLAYLDADQAAAVLTLMPPGVRADLITRVAKLDGVQPEALRELDEVFERQLTGASSQTAAGLGGPKVAAEIMNLLGSANEAPIFEEITKSDGELAQKIQDLMMVFNDLVNANDRGMQELLREVPSDKRAAETLRDDLANKGPVKLSEVEAAQKEILLVAKRLADEGKIQLGNSGGGEAYV